MRAPESHRLGPEHGAPALMQVGLQHPLDPWDHEDATRLEACPAHTRRLRLWQRRVQITLTDPQWTRTRPRLGRSEPPPMRA